MISEVETQYRPFNERAILGAFALLGTPQSYLDVGCGDGWMVNIARRLGCKPALGVDSSLDARKVGRYWATILVRDISRPFVLYDYRNGGSILQFELVTSISADSTISDISTDAYVGNVVRHTGKWLIFVGSTSTTDYWKDCFTNAGLTYNADMTRRLAEMWRWSTGPLQALPHAVQVFQR